MLQRALDLGWLSEAQLELDATELSRHSDASAGIRGLSQLDRLVEAGHLTTWQVAQLRAASLGIDVVDVRHAVVPAEIVHRVPRKFAERHTLLPLEQIDGTLRVAVADPLASSGLDELAHFTGLRIEPVLARADEIAAAQARLYEFIGAMMDGFESAASTGDEPVAMEAAATVERADVADDAPVIAIVREMLAQAVERRASDIHLEPLAKRVRVRHRIDGVLAETSSPPPSRLHAAVVSRLKIMANLSIAEKRLPQDGRIAFRHGGRALDLRVSSIPTVHGESIVMRILDPKNVKRGLGELGFAPDDEARIAQLVAVPDGIVLVTGPTGSGKTTTLYGCLHHLNQPDRKIITAEDPIEYQLSGVNQVPVRAEFGVTFASALRAMLRQAPNVIMVGEIRDLETAEIAVNASLTGHLVFSTLHTNDAPGAVMRLIDLGVKPFLLAAALRAVVAQRLVRRLCARCRQPAVLTAGERAALGFSASELERGTFMRAVGCPACGGTGYRGRLPIFEIFVINDELRSLIHAGAPVALLRAKARVAGMRSLREDGATRVSAGLTTVEEVVSITAEDVPPHSSPNPT